jgi:ABC-type multidrug transport system fused ATPase/permease subunit
MRVVVNRVMSRTLVDALNNLAAIGVLVLGIFLVLNGRWGLSMGDLAAFSAISVTLYRPVRTLARGWARVMDAQPSAERFFVVLDSPIEIVEAPDAVSLPTIREAVRFRDVSFSYGREPVLEHVDFEARAGEVVAIIGRTGAGKTTMVDLLLRFYDPTTGGIEIDGVDLRQARRDSLLDQMAVVTQEPFLFDGSIQDNIRYGRQGATEEEILAAARAAHVDEFVDGLTEGYETEVGAGGTRLSGGQRQRVTIARAILRDPAILVLDEATSSLDSKSERLVQDAIEKLLPGRTVFVIAHRLSTVRAADQIIVLEQGRIAQRGSHDELMAAGGLYRELVDIQTGDVSDEPAVLR